MPTLSAAGGFRYGLSMSSRRKTSTEAALAMAPQPRPETSRNELAALAELPFTVAADLVSCVEGVHQGVATRSFGSVGVLGLPARVVHDRVAGSTYSAIRAVAQAGGRAAAHASTALAPRP